MIRKLLICPWFGPLPPWHDLWKANVASLEPHGYDTLVVTDLAAFKQRVRETLDIDCPIVPGEGKIHDYRAAFGVLFEQEIRAGGYDFWGHTDLDCVYGRVQEFTVDGFLDGLDLYSNHASYVCGPWTLYRNRLVVNMLFATHPDWRAILEAPDASGWVEKGFTEVVDATHEVGVIRRAYVQYQTRSFDDFSTVRWDGDRLMEGNEEVCLVHFRRTKVYPPGAVR